jgi:hypothetical protein
MAFSRSKSKSEAASPPDRERLQKAAGSEPVIAPHEFESSRAHPPSGVWRRPLRSESPADATARSFEPRVTLRVSHWIDVDPGPLAWTFDGIDEAVSAARALRNASGWVIVEGESVDPSSECDPAEGPQSKVLMRHPAQAGEEKGEHDD